MFEDGITTVELDVDVRAGGWYKPIVGDGLTTENYFVVEWWAQMQPFGTNRTLGLLYIGWPSNGDYNNNQNVNLYTDSYGSSGYLQPFQTGTDLDGHLRSGQMQRQVYDSKARFINAVYYRVYAANGSRNGFLGFANSDVYTGSDGIQRQNFTGGCIANLGAYGTYAQYWGDTLCPA